MLRLLYLKKYKKIPHIYRQDMKSNLFAIFPQNCLSNRNKRKSAEQIDRGFSTRWRHDFSARPPTAGCSRIFNGWGHMLVPR